MTATPPPPAPQAANHKPIASHHKVKMDHRSVSAAAAGGAIAIGPSPAPHRTMSRPTSMMSGDNGGGGGGGDNGRPTCSNHGQQQRRRCPMTIIRSVAVPTTIAEKQRNILRFRAKATPWSGAAEFDAVGRGLLLATALFPPPSAAEQHQHAMGGGGGGGGCCPLGANERSELDHALRSVAVWRDRAEGGRLPHSVETSAALASVLLEDATAHDSDGGSAHSYMYYHHGHHGRSPSELSLRMSYASAVIRATNGLADASVTNRGMKKPGYGVSVAALCERIGIPGWVVDMRHDAAHNDLPSLPSLRLASKTLLGYLGDRYWSELVRLRGDAAAKAVGILDAYKASAKAAAVEHTARMNQQIAKAEARAIKMKEKRAQERAGKKTKKKNEGKQQQEEEGSDDDDDCMEFGRFSIFADTSRSSSSKKKGKKRPREGSVVAGDANDDATSSTSKEQDVKKEGSKEHDAQKDESSEPTKGSTDDSNKDTTADATSKPKKQKLPSPLKLASQFVEEVTIDTGLQILLSYLVWGGVGDMPPEKGALVPGSPATILETEQGFDKVKNRYVLLLAKISTAYTGFLHALVVNLVDLILLIEERHAGNDDVAMDAGDQRKLFFLGRWVKYLVSREFHSHFDPHLGVFPKGKIDLTRKRVWKWTEAEKSFMADCAPFEALHRWQFPLNSLYQRCTSSPSASGGGKVSELISLFEKADGDHILDDNVEVAGNIKTHADANNDQASSSEKKARAEEIVEENSSPPPHLKGGASGMSLEQMEALLSDSDAEDDHGDDSKPKEDTRVNGTNGDEDALETPSNCEVTAWSQCKSWEACAIGTLPGYPSFY